MKLRIALIVIAIIIGVGVSFFGLNFRPNAGPLGVKNFSKGQTYPAALIASLLPGPIQDDLVKRGLVSLPQDSGQGSVNEGGIQELIQQGLYFIDPNNRLQTGPVSVPSQLFQFAGNANYLYALRSTQLWAFLDDFSYTGHSVSVKIPANLDVSANSTITHNLYNTHLTLPDGKFVESGVGWVNWTASPIIYTYQSYTGHWNFASIPSGTQRDIFLKVEISSDKTAVMYAFDPLSNKSVTTRQQVGTLNHRVDLTQEQFSNTNQWLNTPPALFHDSQIRKGVDDSWVNWDSKVVSSWINNPPLFGEKVETDNQISTETWCSTQ